MTINEGEMLKLYHAEVLKQQQGECHLLVDGIEPAIEGTPVMAPSNGRNRPMP